MRRLLVTLGIAVGALGVGVGAAATVDGVAGDEVPVDGSTTTTEATTTTTTEASTTTTTAETSTTTTTAETSTTTTTTEVPASDAPKADAQPGEAPYGLCNAFSGRPQPGNSQAWARLDEQAGGNIEAFCADVLAAHPEKHADDAEREGDDASQPAHPKGNGKAKGHKKGD